MTLEKCSSIYEFAARRWFRLFPAMLASSSIILAFDRLVGVGPYVDRTTVNMLPGLLFVSPALIHSLTGATIDSMDVTFWSLYVEVSFYAVFGIAYFAFGRDEAIWCVAAVWIVCYLANCVSSLGFGGSLFGRVAAAMLWLGFSNYGFFASGALFYKYATDGVRRHLLMAILIGVLSALTTEIFKYSVPERLALLTVVLIFAITILSEKARTVSSMKPLLFFGFVSYPLYLVHNNILVGTMNVISQLYPQLPMIFVPVFPTAIIVGFAYMIARYIEPFMQSLRPRALVRGSN
jgi:peptidoglycan/LPS O-acetylase OafA/YrhL